MHVVRATTHIREAFGYNGLFIELKRRKTEP